LEGVTDATGPVPALRAIAEAEAGRAKVTERLETAEAGLEAEERAVAKEATEEALAGPVPRRLRCLRLETLEADMDGVIELALLAER